jgi:hypothetical protein
MRHLDRWQEACLLAEAGNVFEVVRDLSLQGLQICTFSFQRCLCVYVYAFEVVAHALLQGLGMM